MASIFNQLVGVKLPDSTVEQLETGSKNTYVASDSIEYWRGIIAVSKIMEATRTYAHGLPVPEQSAVEVLTVEASATGFIKPEGTEIWSIQGIDVDNCAIALTDGTNFVNFASDSGYISRARNPIYLTNTLFFAFTNASGSQQTPSVAYHKVGL